MRYTSKIQAWCCDNPLKTIVIVSLLVRVLISLLYGHITLYPDTEGYKSLAERLFYRDLFGYQGERSPGYPLVICLTGFSDVLLAGLQMVMGVCTLVLVYKVLRILHVSNSTALLASLPGAIYLPMVFFELALLTEAFTLLLITLIFYLFFSILNNQKKGRRVYACLALLCGYLVLIKMFYIFLAFLLFGILLVQHRDTWKQQLKKSIAVLLIPLFVFLGWSYVNKLNTGYFVSTTYYGFNLAQNCVWFADKTTPEYQEIGDIYAKYRSVNSGDKEVAMTIWEAYPELAAHTGLAFPDFSRLLYDYSIATIKKNPVSYLEQVCVSWRDFWKTSLYWETYSFSVPQVVPVITYICYAERIVLQLIKLLFVLLIPYNLFVAFRKRQFTPEAVLAIVIFSASILQALVTYGTNSRFSYPFEILMATSVLLNVLAFCKYRQNKKLHPGRDAASL